MKDPEKSVIPRLFEIQQSLRTAASQGLGRKRRLRARAIALFGQNLAVSPRRDHIENVQILLPPFRPNARFLASTVWAVALLMGFGRDSGVCL